MGFIRKKKKHGKMVHQREKQPLVHPGEARNSAPEGKLAAGALQRSEK